MRFQSPHAQRDSTEIHPLPTNLQQIADAPIPEQTLLRGWHSHCWTPGMGHWAGDSELIGGTQAVPETAAAVELDACIVETSYLAIF